MKSLIRRLIPHSLLERYRRFRRRTRTAEDVFTEIYEKNVWGGSRGEFYSGLGSTDQQIVSAYISMVSEEASSEGFLGLGFVDLGCGDFRVGRQLLPLCSSYIGVDIVKPLIRRNQQTYGNATARFMHLDIVNDELPDGDVCFVRQVLQHLSNQQIAAILPKLKKYRWVFITEHHPTDSDAIKPNRDKVHGFDIRVGENSGVYLSKPPFKLPGQTLRKVLEIPGTDLGKGNDPGVICTFLYKPGGFCSGAL